MSLGVLLGATQIYITTENDGNLSIRNWMEQINFYLELFAYVVKLVGLLDSFE